MQKDKAENTAELRSCRLREGSGAEGRIQEEKKKTIKNIEREERGGVKKGLYHQGRENKGMSRCGQRDSSVP